MIMENFPLVLVPSPRLVDRTLLILFVSCLLPQYKKGRISLQIGGQIIL
jgi:hypothetical protein